VPIKKKIKFNHKQLSVLMALRENRGLPLTAHEIAEYTQLSWETVKKTLIELFRMGFVKKRKRKEGSITKWMLVSKKKGK